MRSPFPYRGSGQPAVWLVADYHARFLCRFADICIGIYPGDRRSATDCLAFRCPSLDAGTGRFLCGSGIDSACRLGCAVQPTGVRSTAFIIIGISSLVYAASELLNWFKFTRRRPKTPDASVKAVDDIEDAQIIE